MHKQERLTWKPASTRPRRHTFSSGHVWNEQPNIGFDWLKNSIDWRLHAHNVSPFQASRKWSVAQSQRAIRILIALSALPPGIKWTQLLALTPSVWWLSRWTCKPITPVVLSDSSLHSLVLNLPALMFLPKISRQMRMNMFFPRSFLLISFWSFSAPKNAPFPSWSLICASGSFGGPWSKGMP